MMILIVCEFQSLSGIAELRHRLVLVNRVLWMLNLYHSAE